MEVGLISMFLHVVAGCMYVGYSENSWWTCVGQRCSLPLWSCFPSPQMDVFYPVQSREQKLAFRNVMNKRRNNVQKLKKHLNIIEYQLISEFSLIPSLQNPKFNSIYHPCRVPVISPQLCFCNTGQRATQKTYPACWWISMSCRLYWPISPNISQP